MPICHALMQLAEADCAHTGMQVDGIEPRLVEAAQKVRVGAVCGHGIGYFKLHYGETNHSGLAEDETQVTSHRLLSTPWHNMSKYQLWCEQIHRL